MKKRLFAVAMSFGMAVSMLPGLALASDAQESYVALGDSITTGYGLADPAAAFPELVAEQNDFSLTNLAEDGATSADLLATVQDPANLAAISGADIVTVTIGGNDLMSALYEFLAAGYQALDPTMTAEKMQELLVKGDPITIAAAAQMIPDFAASDQAADALTDITTNLAGAIGAVKTANPDVQVIVATQYNPYQQAADAAVGATAEAAGVIDTAFNTGVTVLNTAIQQVCSTAQCTVADVYTTFAQSDQNPCNASCKFLNLDFHPNTYGHTLIADLVNGLVDLPEENTPAVEPDPDVSEPDTSGETVVPPVASGWNEYNGNRYFLLADGTPAANEWLWYDNQWYFFNAAGEMVSADWVKWNGKWYFLYASGQMATNATIDGYYVDSDGVLVQ